MNMPAHIYGMHDRGGEHLMLEAGRPGWVLVTEALGADRGDCSGADYSDLAARGLGVIARLNHGYGDAGTLPYSPYYNSFATRCGNFAQASRGCHIWIVGNEPNLAWERPGGVDGEVIIPLRYAQCYLRCRQEIRSRPGHEGDLVLTAAPAVWNTQTRYERNKRGDWVQYLADVLHLLGDQVDGISLHTYTHGVDPGLVFSNARLNPPFSQYHYHFRAYQDFMAAIPPWLRDRPVFITEADQDVAWADVNSGWVQAAYAEIDSWNMEPGNQPIQALILYRWIVGDPNSPADLGWAICDKPGVQDDFRAALRAGYRVP